MQKCNNLIVKHTKHPCTKLSQLVCAYKTSEYFYYCKMITESFVIISYFKKHATKFEAQV